MPKNNPTITGKYTNYEEDKTLTTAAALVLGTKEVVVEQPASRTYNSSVKLQSLRDAHVQYTGEVTKRQYEWIRAGSVQVVDALDAPYLLSKRIKSQSCCSESDMPIFQAID